ncbi:hypothetical protein [Streptomyces sp. MJP52]|uniref:hypothetical protein n=1 Tax=Streptomyces sp. MJP52 TaxID=2940555 RepID=UPI002474FF93|nr:hypothetical protein [Streptomyces sp. MJP52]MDH6223671.1 thymidylate kinase [Streptomyces sp. MJP52]
MLLALEGIAGAGKSTLRDRLLAASAAEGRHIGSFGQFSWLSLQATRVLTTLRAGRPAVHHLEALDAARHDLELHARYNLAPALELGPVVADRLTLSTACLLALVHDRPVDDYIPHLAKIPAARADLTVLLCTDPAICTARLAHRATGRRFGEDLRTAARLADLYERAATLWTEATGLPVLRYPCVTEDDLDLLTTTCLRRLHAADVTAPI